MQHMENMEGLILLVISSKWSWEGNNDELKRERECP